jgi:putative ABC transport system permease protein
VAFHFDQLVAEFTAEGMPPADARHAAHRALGNVAVLEAQCRDQRRMIWWHDFWRDLAYGLGMLRRNPGFTVIAAASLAIGIGANTAVLGVMDTLVGGGLSFQHADRLVLIRTFALDSPQRNNNATVPDYFAWKARSRAFEAMGASLPEQKDLGPETGGAAAERMAGMGMTPGVFQALGVRPILGRFFTDAESQVGNPAPVIVISQEFWQRRFAAAPDIINTVVRLDGAPTTIIGVMPSGFHYPNGRSLDYWAPLPLTPSQLQASARFFLVTARLKPGVTVQQAERDLAAINTQLAGEFPDRPPGWGVRVEPLHDVLLGWTRQRLLTFEAAVAMVLLIACANVAGLLLARASVRHGEFAVRMALGAGRSRIVRQLVAESVLLSSIGGVLAIGVAWGGLRALGTMRPPIGGVPIGEVSLDARMFLIMAALSAFSGLLFGLAPALAVFKLNLAGSLNESVRGTGTHAGGHRVRGALVAGQIALSLVLLIGTGLLLNSLVRLAGRELNFDPRGLLTFEVRVPANDYRRTGAAAGAVNGVANGAPALTLARLYERLRALPGPESVAGISLAPVNSLVVPTLAIRVEGKPAPTRAADRTASNARYFLVTPNFFATMKAPLLRGREVQDRDTASAPWVAVINETAARRFWPGEDPIGKRFTLDVASGERPLEVVGVVRDIPLRSAYVDIEPVIYAPFVQQAELSRGPFAAMVGQMTFLLRTAADPFALLPAARRVVAEIDPDRAVARAMPMDWYIDGGLWDRGAYLVVLGVFAIAATVLAAIGLYGVMTYSVSQRTREIGVRVAMGASARAIVALIVRGALPLISAGLVLGLAVSVAFSRLLASLMWEIVPTDPLTFAAVSLLLILVALAACIVPVRRALNVDPTVALRYE